MTSTTTSDVVVKGITYSTNDCVYLKPESPADPLFIGRIMQFVQNPKGIATRFKVQWFSRRSDESMSSMIRELQYSSDGEDDGDDEMGAGAVKRRGRRKKPSSLSHHHHRMLYATMNCDLNQ